MLPFAGGNVYSYRLLENELAPKLQTHPLELPGRGRRFTEALITDIATAVDDLFNHIREYLGNPYAFFGHSMGSVLACLLTTKIKQEGYPLPVHIFCSGRSGLWNAHPEPWYLLPSDAFWKKINDLGGLPLSNDLNDEIRTIFEPILRADFRLVQIPEKGEFGKRYLVDVPMTVFLGKDDRITTEPSSWHRHTQCSPRVVYFEGNHFYFLDQYTMLAEYIKNILFDHVYS